VAAGVALRDLHVEETAGASGGRILVWLASRKRVDDARIGPGDPVRLWWIAPEDPSTVIGTVSRRSGARLAVMIDGDVDLPGSFHLDRDEPQATFDRGDRALARLGDDARWTGLLCDAKAPVFGASPPALRFLDDGLNDPQRAAVARGLAALDYVLIHGPPGTGKTRTLVEIVRQAVARGERVLSTAASNTAVDNLAERLVDAGTPAIRLGHPARVSPAMEAHTLDALLDADDTAQLARGWIAEAAELRARAAKKAARAADRDEVRSLRAEAGRLERDARDHLRRVQAAILARARVVCATAAGADAALLADASFDLVVLDEATQAPDPIALVAMLRGKRAVLAGDPRQLPPTVIDLQAAREGLGTTFFERLPGPTCLLTVQHRMNQELMAFPSAQSYEGKLVAAPQVAHARLADLGGVADDPDREGPFVLIDTAGTGFGERREGEDPSTSNPGHAERTAREARRLIARGLSPADLAVITPYDAQVRLLRELLAAERDAGLEIGTVDGFQGREKEAIIVDLVRSNDDGELGFLTDIRRTNVAITRARRFLLVVGDGATLGRHPYYAALVQHAETTGAWRSAWTD
jgi:superfamily I DNA and/or RNA helicase